MHRGASGGPHSLGPRFRCGDAHVGPPRADISCFLRVWGSYGDKCILHLFLYFTLSPNRF
jgi:hypothetical protein